MSAVALVTGKDRPAGFATVDFSEASELTLLFYPFLMFIGGAAGSVAGVTRPCRRTADSDR